MRWTVIKVLNHRVLRVILIILCALCICFYFIEIRGEDRVLSLDDVIPALIDNVHLRRRAQSMAPPPSAIASPIAENTKYSASHPLRIRIAIPSSCQQRESNLRRMQRMSWMQYLDRSNPLWQDMHSQCTLS